MANTNVRYVFKYEEIAGFNSLREEIVAAMESGVVSDSRFTKWLLSDTTKESVNNQKPGKTKNISFDCFGNNASKVAKILNTRIPPDDYRSREVVATYIAGSIVPNYKTMSDEDKLKECEPIVEWINDNCDNNNIDAVFQSKKGRGGGITLRKEISVEAILKDMIPF